MATPRDRRQVYKRSDHVEAVPASRPMKFKSYRLPEYFYYTAYLFDSDGRQVTSTNSKNFKTWSVRLLIRITQTETLEVITSEVIGASDYKGHTVLRLGAEPSIKFSKLQPVKPSYYKAVADNRANLMAFAITSAVQSLIYKKLKDGSHSWPLFTRAERTEQELQALAKGVIDQSYKRKDDAFYRDVARVYKEAVSRGEWPNEVLKQVYGVASTKTVQGWTLRAYRLGYLSDKDKSKVRKVKKTPTKKRGK